MKETLEGHFCGADDEHYFVYPKEKTLSDLYKKKNTTAEKQKEKVEDEEGKKHSSVCTYIDMINDASQKLKIGFEQYLKAKEDEISKLKNELAAEKLFSDGVHKENQMLVQNLHKAKAENQQLTQNLDEVKAKNKQLTHDSEATQAENRQLAYKLYQAQESNKQLAQKLDEVQTENKLLAHDLDEAQKANRHLLMTWMRLRKKIRSWLRVRERLWRNAACWNLNWKRLRRKTRSSVRNLMKQEMKSAVRISPFVA